MENRDDLRRPRRRRQGYLLQPLDLSEIRPNHRAFTFGFLRHRIAAAGADRSVSNPSVACVHRNPIAIVEIMTWPLFVHAVEQRLP